MNQTFKNWLLTDLKKLLKKKNPDNVLVIHQVACNHEQLVSTPTYEQRYNLLKHFVFLHPPDTTLNMDS